MQKRTVLRTRFLFYDFVPQSYRIQHQASSKWLYSFSPLLTFRSLLFFDHISPLSVVFKKELSLLLLTWLVPHRALCHSRRGKEEVEGLSVLCRLLLDGFKLSFIVKFSIGGGHSVSGQPLGMSFSIILYLQ